MDNNNTQPVKIIENFVSADDCKYLIETYDQKVIPSKVVSDTNSSAELHPSRTSSTFFIPDDDPVIVQLRKKASELVLKDEKNIEGIQFLKYKKGERFLFHHDFLKTVNLQNQRVDTIIVYLNDLDETDGGATAFFHYQMRVRPQKGRAVWFKNCDEKGNLINESLHAGEEILTDTIKYALNIWIRQCAVVS